MQQATQSGAFVERHQARGAVELDGIGDDAQQPPPRPCGDPRAPRRALILDGHPRVLDELAVAHPRRTGRLAGAAPKAAIEMRDGMFGRREPAGGELLHEMDAAARRLGLEARDQIGRAGLEADAAVDARASGLDVERDRSRRWESSRTGGGGDGHTDYVTGIRPGASTSRGSKRRLSAAAIAAGMRGVPHTPSARFWSSVARSSTSAPPSASAEARSARSRSVAPPRYAVPVPM